MTVQRIDGVGYTITTEIPRPGMVVTVARPATPPTTPVLGVIGDSFSDPFFSERGWPLIVAEAIGGRLVNLSRGGCGYVQSVGSTFGLAATKLPSDVTAVVVAGSLNDLEQDPADVAVAAEATYATIRRLVPDAALIVVGPIWPATTPTPNVAAVRDGIRDAARSAGAVWVDALDWFQGHPDLIGGDGWHPNLTGQRLIADRLRPVVAAAVRP